MTGEPTREHGIFRLYRDTPAPRRDLAKLADQVDLSYRRVRELADKWAWRERAEAWDDTCHRVEDQERLEAIRSMHEIHRKAGRAAVMKAAQALSSMDADAMPATAVARLLELGAKLERSTLLTSVEELQGLDVEPDEAEDPWDRIARELDPSGA
jgi:hypothetical protein